MMKNCVLKISITLLSFFGTFSFVSANNEKLSFIENSIELKQNSTPTAVDDAVTAVHYASGIFYNPTELLAVTTTISVLSNDSYGSDGPTSAHEPLTLVNGKQSTATINGGLISVSDNGTANDKTDDVVTYLPPKGFSGTDSFTYSITDASGDAATATVTITVASAAPLEGAVNDTLSVDENSTDNIIDVLANDNFGASGVGRMLINSPNHLTGTTAQGGILTLDDGGTSGINQADDKILYSPPANFTGVDTFDYTLTVDSSQYQGTVTITVGNVIPVADTPTAVDDSSSVAFGSSNNIISILSNDSYGSNGPTSAHEPLTLVNGKQSTATLKGALISVSDNGTANDKTDDVVLYSAPSGFTGTDSFTYAITDASGDAATATVTITVNGVITDVPTAEDDTVSVDENSSDNVIDILANDDFGSDGAYAPPISFSAGLVTQGFYITTDTSDEGGTVTIVNDTEIHYTPAANFTGSDRFTYYIYDASGDRALGVVNVTVGNVTPPVNDTLTAQDDTASVAFGSTNNVIDVLDNDSFGTDGAINGGLTMTNGTLSSASTNGGLISIDNKNTLDTLDDEFLYSAPAGFSGTDTFSYTITDANGDASTAKVTVTVAALLVDIPNALDDSVSVDENSTDNVIDVIANDDFGSDGPYTYPINLSSLNGAGSSYLTQITTSLGGSVQLNDNNTPQDLSDDVYLYTPAANFTGIDAFFYYIYDADGDLAQAVVTITVGNVIPVADTPTAVDDTSSVAFGSSNNIISILSNDSYGSDGPTSAHEPLTLVNGKQSTATLNGALISVSDNGTVNDKTDDVVLYSAPSGFTGTDSFTYAITDATGDAATATVTIIVNGIITDVPTAEDDTVSVDENSSDNVIDILANDSFGSDGASTPPMSFSAGLFTQGFYITTDTSDEGGTVTIVNDEEIHYTPAANFTGSDRFTYYIYDASGDRDLGVVNVTVGNVAPPVNDTPTAVNDSATVDFGSTNNVIDVLDNDSFGSDGAINEGLTMTNGTLSSASTNGGLISVDNKNTLDTLDDEYLYSAPAGFSGTDTFSYTITDASGDASTGTVTVTVNTESNDPEAVDDYYNVDENSSNNIIDPLANDNKGDNSVGIMFVQIPDIYSQPFVNQQGTLTLLDNNTPNDTSDDTLSFTPAQGFTGVYEFHYLYSVGEQGGSFTQVGYGYVYITVGAVTPPSGVLEAIEDNETVERYSLINYIDVLSNDSFGANGPSLTHPLTLSNGRSTGTTAGNRFIQVHDNNTPNDLTDDTISYSPGSLVSDSFTYTITDASGFATQGTVYITATESQTKASIEVVGNTIFENEFLIYSNPSIGGKLRGTVFSSVSNKATISLIDINGKLIYKTTQNFNEGRNDLDLTVNAKPGIMFLRITSSSINYGISRVIFK